MHKHITSNERDIIALHLGLGKNYTEIGKIIGKHKSTISREIAKNSTYVDWHVPNRGQIRTYFPDKAQKKYELRFKSSHAVYPFKNADVCRYVLEKLTNEAWSPRTISGRMKKEYPKDTHMRISHECIYQHCFSIFGKKNNLSSHLLRAGKKRKKRVYKTSGAGFIPNRVDISLRPKYIEKRKQFGHWEDDTIVGINQTPGALTAVERKTKYLKASLIRSRKSEEITRKTTYLLNPNEVRTITNDNGKEFSGHKEVAAKLSCQVYFCTPYCSSERGTNENTNGLIRRTYPKGTDFRRIKESDFQKVIEKLNNTPRECLNWSTPREAYERELAKCCI